MKPLKHLLLILLLSTAASSLYSCSDEIEICDVSKYKIEIDDVEVWGTTRNSATVAVYIRNPEIYQYFRYWDIPKLRWGSGYYDCSSYDEDLSDIKRGEYVYECKDLKSGTEYSVYLGAYSIDLPDSYVYIEYPESEILTSFTTDSSYY